MARRLGRNVGRELIGGDRSNQLIGEDQLRRTEGEAPTLQRAVVLDVVMDPGLLEADEVQSIRDTVNNPELAPVMPPNSVIARMVSDAQGIAAKANTILLPFFSSHMMLPVKPGEIVEVIYDDYSGDGHKIGYWMTRTSAERTIEDVNYTHLDRRFDASMNPANYSTSQRSERGTTQPGPGFQNGGNTPQTFTIQPSSSQDRPYDSITREARAYRSADEQPVVTPEPVPRWQKRPQELVFQGSNNTIIVFGEDRRSGPLGAIQGPEAERDAKGQSGTIDMIAGRGRILPANDDEQPEHTAPKTITNTRNARETDKAPYRRMPGEARLGDNPNEGNPDFRRDAARVYVTMQSEVDNKFGITGIEYPENTLAVTEQPSEGTATTFNKSYVVGKADHVRHIARKDEDNGIEGTVLLLREGTAGEDLGYVYLEKRGIQIEHNKIYLGEATGEGEPYIKWTEFKKTIDHLQQEISDLRTALQNQHDETNTQFGQLITTLQTAFASATAVPYSPIASLSTAAGQLPPLSQKLNTKIGAEGPKGKTAVDTGKSNTDQSVEDSKSEKIYGE